MKKICFFVLTVLFSISSYSQIGIKAGADYGTLAGHDASTYRWGMHGGLTYDFQLSKKLYIQPGVMLSFQSFGLENHDEILEGKANKLYLEVPVNLSFRPQISRTTKLMIDFGPYFKYGMAGDKNVKLDHIYAGDTQVKGSSFDDSYKAALPDNRDFTAGYNTWHKFAENGDTFQFNRLDFGLNVGLGVQVQKRYNVGVAYQYGLLNGERGKSGTHNSIFRLSLGYTFR